MTNSDAGAALRGILEHWADGIARHEPTEVAGLFTEDALFQGFDPTPGRGRESVAAYYDKQPLGLAARLELLEVRTVGADAVLGFARVEFDRPDGVVPVYLTVVAERSRGANAGWALSHYHVSRIGTA